MRPSFWYGIPHGYAQLDLAPSTDHVEAMMRQVQGLPDGVRERASQALQFYAGAVTLLNAQKVQGCAIGVHPDEAGGYAMSVLTVASVSSAGIDPKLVLADMVRSAAASDSGEGVRPVELPCGTGLLAETKRRVVAPGRQRAEGDVWQGTVAVPDAGSSEIVLVQLVTAAVDQADDYLRVLLGVAHTVTFSDPAPVPSPTSGVADSMRSDFG